MISDLLEKSLVNMFLYFLASNTPCSSHSKVTFTLCVRRTCISDTWIMPFWRAWVKLKMSDDFKKNWCHWQKSVPDTMDVKDLFLKGPVSLSSSIKTIQCGKMIEQTWTEYIVLVHSLSPCSCVCACKSIARNQLILRTEFFYLK